HDGDISPGSLRLHVDQVLGLGNSDKRRIGRVTQPQPYKTLFIVCVGLFGIPLELRGAGKRLQFGKKMDEVKHVDWLSVVGFGPRADTGHERLNTILRQRQLFDDRQVLIDLRLRELARSLRMPGPEGHVQNNERSAKNELKPHLSFLLEFVCSCRNQSWCKTRHSSNRSVTSVLLQHTVRPRQFDSR